MSRAVTSQGPSFPVHRFTVDQYNRMIQTGILNEDDNVELIRGVIVPKMAKGDPHDTAIEYLDEQLRPLLPATVSLRCQCVLTLPDSVPELDFTVCIPARARQGKYPKPSETFVVIEVSDTSVYGDRTTKLQMYAENGIPVYWIVNLEDRQIEVYTHPATPAGANPHYQTRTDYKPGQDVPLVLAGSPVGTISIDAVLP